MPLGGSRRVTYTESKPIALNEMTRVKSMGAKPQMEWKNWMKREWASRNAETRPSAMATSPPLSPTSEREQISFLEAAFKEMDYDGDGWIDEDEFVTFCREQHAFADSGEASARRLFANADTAQNGRLDRREFQQAMLTTKIFKSIAESGVAGSSTAHHSAPTPDERAAGTPSRFPQTTTGTGTLS